MSLNTLTTTLTPTTPDRQLRSGAYLFSNPSPQSVKSSSTPGKSPSNGGVAFSLDPAAYSMTERAPTPANDSVNGDGEWSSAVGRASVAGKSGRVIERLMGEVDKLKRELNLAQARVEEEQSRSISAREALDSLRDTKDNLEAICETNRNIILRRDRKIEDLRTELDTERSQRTAAERGRNELGVEIQTLKRECDREVLRASELAARATSEYEIFKKSLQRMKGEWEKQVGQMRKELDVVQQDRDGERVMVRDLGRVCEQLRAEQYKMNVSFDRVTKEYSSYRLQADEMVQRLREKVSDGDKANEELHSELQKTLGEMRWVINVRKNVRSLQNDASESKG